MTWHTADPGIQGRDPSIQYRPMFVCEIGVENDVDFVDLFRFVKVIFDITAGSSSKILNIVLDIPIDSVPQQFHIALGFRLQMCFCGQFRNGSVVPRNVAVIIHQGFLQFCNLLFIDSAGRQIIFYTHSGGGTDCLTFNSASCHNTCCTHCDMGTGNIPSGKIQIFNIL